MSTEQFTIDFELSRLEKAEELIEKLDKEIDNLTANFHSEIDMWRTAGRFWFGCSVFLFFLVLGLIYMLMVS